MRQKILGWILGCALLCHGSAALAFTLIPPALQPGTTFTNSYTLDAQVQPIAGTIRSQIFGLRRTASTRNVTQVDGMMLAANDRSGTSSDVNYLAAANAPAGGGSLSARNTHNLWVSSATDSLENTFSTIAFYGATQNVLIGYDFTRSDKYVLGISGGYEASNFVTTFNSGNEKTRGYNINPYFAWLLSDAWSLDVIGGVGKFKTNQSRTEGTGALTTQAVDSNFMSHRGFLSTNLTEIQTAGNWKFTGSLGYQWSKRIQEAYEESGGATAESVPESKQSSKQWNALGELAYGRGNSEGFFGARYEDIKDYKNIELFGGAGEQPANDRTSWLLSAGWRYFGRGVTASFMLNQRVGQEQVKGYGVAMVLRAEL